MTDTNAPAVEGDLLTPPWDDAIPLDQIPEEHRDRVAQERADAEASARQAEADARAAEAAKTTPSEPSSKTGSGAKTKARRDPVAAAKAPKTIGARPRKKAAEPEPAPDVERVVVVLKTSRYTNPATGRQVARRTPVRVSLDLGLKLVMQDHAREAETEAEKAAAVITLD